MPSVQKLTLILLLLFGFIFTFPSLAKAGWELPAPATWDARKNTNFSINNSLQGSLCIFQPGMAGCVADFVNQDGTHQTKVSTGNNSGFAYGGPLVSLAGLTSALYQAPPTSSVEYIASLGKDFGIIQSAYAQTKDVPGSGAGIIQPVLKIWQVSRNIAYLFFIAIFLVVGFMIMLRRKLNPQTVITAQAALPGLVVGLLLVTFSYFIAALMIDLAFIGVKLVGYLFSDNVMHLLNKFGKPEDLANNSSLFELFKGAAGETVPSMGEFLSGAVDLKNAAGNTGLLIATVVGAVVGALAGPFGILLGAGLGVVAGGAAFELGPHIVTVLVGLVLLIALFIQLFRLFFGLVNSYIQILVLTIGGPLVILYSAIPGKGGAIGGWIKGLIAHALAFPAVFAAFMFAGALLANTSPSDWAVSPPLFGNLPASLIRIVLAYAIVLGTPAIPGMIRDTLGVKGLPGGIDKAAIGGFVGGFGVARAGTGGFTSRMKMERQARVEATAKGRAGLIPMEQVEKARAAQPTWYRPWLWGS